jgi:hypothetical protein
MLILIKKEIFKIFLQSGGKIWLQFQRVHELIAELMLHRMRAKRV